jgi:hypothetical protein
MNRTACAKHHQTNIVNCTPEVKELAMQLLYGRNITIHMAYECRDALLTLVSTNSSMCSKTKDWFIKTFGTDDGMKVSVHSPIFCHPKQLADKHASISEFYDDLRILFGLTD